MGATMVRLSAGAKARLQKLAAETGCSLTETVERAIDCFERKVFFDRLNRGYEELRADPEAWAAHRSEMGEWDVALNDGLGELDGSEGESAGAKSRSLAGES